MITAQSWQMGGYIATAVTWVMAIGVFLLVRYSDNQKPRKSEPKKAKRTSLHRPSRQVN